MWMVWYNLLIFNTLFTFWEDSVYTSSHVWATSRYLQFSCRVVGCEGTTKRRYWKPPSRTSPYQSTQVLVTLRFPIVSSSIIGTRPTAAAGTLIDITKQNVLPTQMPSYRLINICKARETIPWRGTQFEVPTAHIPRIGSSGIIRKFFCNIWISSNRISPTMRISC